MKVDVSSILKDPGASLPFEVTATVGELSIDAGPAEVLGPLCARGVATSLGGAVYVEASVRGTVALGCSRCLATFEMPVDLSCEGKFGASVPKKGDADDEDEVEVFPLEGAVCDLGEMVRHELVLSLPMKPLCSETCKGLCSICGKNLNEGNCECASGRATTTAFGRKLLEALEERGKKDGRP